MAEYILKALQRAMERELARMYIDEEKLREEMAGYNQSGFLAGYKYALDCVMGDIKMLSAERDKNG